MKVTVFEGTPDEIKKVLQAITSSEEQNMIIKLNGSKISQPVLQAIRDTSLSIQET